mgnify:CR=1 FL=1
MTSKQELQRSKTNRKGGLFLMEKTLAERLKELAEQLRQKAEEIRQRIEGAELNGNSGINQKESKSSQE